MRIFIGLLDTANIVANYAKGFEALGHETFTLLWTKTPFYADAQYDIVVDDLISPPGIQFKPLTKTLARIRRRAFVARQFLKALGSCDIFLFVFGTSFLPAYLDYPVIGLFGKLLGTVFLGDDIRHWYVYEEQMKFFGLAAEIQPLLDYFRTSEGGFHEKMRRVKVAERYADLILSQPSMDQLQRRRYMRANIPLDLSQFRFHVPGREIPLILHAPSNRTVKGTVQILAAVDQLRHDGVRFDFRLLEGVPNATLRELLSEADIVVDQIFSDTVATLALESMATGNAVLARYLPELALIPKECPVVNVNAGNLVDKLREVILDRNTRKELAQRGRPFVERYHDHVGVAQQILDWMKPGGIQNYHFTPAFFKENFKMPKDLIRKELASRWSSRMEGLKWLLFRTKIRSTDL